MKKIKPVLKDWKIHEYFGTVYLTGEVYGNPKFTDGENIRTSKLKRIDFEKGEAVTQNTIIRLEELK